MKEIKSNDRNYRKRNAGGGEKSKNDVRVESESFCADYASDCKEHALNMRNKDFVEGNPFIWTEKSGKLYLEFTDFE